MKYIYSYFLLLVNFGLVSGLLPVGERRKSCCWFSLSGGLCDSIIKPVVVAVAGVAVACYIFIFRSVENAFNKSLQQIMQISKSCL